MYRNPTYVPYVQYPSNAQAGQQPLQKQTRDLSPYIVRPTSTSGPNMAIRPPGYVPSPSIPTVQHQFPGHPQQQSQQVTYPPPQPQNQTTTNINPAYPTLQPMSANQQTPLMVQQQGANHFNPNNSMVINQTTRVPEDYHNDSMIFQPNNNGYPTQCVPRATAHQPMSAHHHHTSSVNTEQLRALHETQEIVGHHSGGAVYDHQSNKSWNQVDQGLGAGENRRFSGGFVPGLARNNQNNSFLAKDPQSAKGSSNQQQPYVCLAKKFRFKDRSNNINNQEELNCSDIDVGDRKNSSFIDNYEQKSPLVRATNRPGYNNNSNNKSNMSAQRQTSTTTLDTSIRDTRKAPILPESREISAHKKKFGSDAFQHQNKNSPRNIENPIVSQEERLLPHRRTSSLGGDQKSNMEFEEFAKIGRRSMGMIHKLPEFEEEEPRPISYAWRSRSGNDVGMVTKTNQDSFIISPNLANNTRVHYFAVNDGHGINGHHVSGFLKENLPNLLGKTLTKTKNPKISIISTFEQVNRKLHGSAIDITYSGSTSVSLLVDNNHLYCANVGDSRAILGRLTQDQGWDYVLLSRDHKPDTPSENNRIIKHGGRVQPYYDEEGKAIGPPRVWVANDDKPGLAMSRSFGDRLAASVGVTWIPEIIDYKLSPEDKFIILASDGVWEFISNEDCIRIVAPYFEEDDLEGASDRILREAVARWKKEEEIIDDITFILMFLK